MTQSKIALVTGGSRGLGKNIALRLASKGHDLIITYRSQKEEADAVVSEIEKLGQKAAALQLDVSISSTFDNFISEVSKTLKDKWQRNQFDFLVNNAGIGIHKSIELTTEEDFDALCNIHFKGVFFLTQKSIPLLANGGRIVNISTGLTRFATPGYAAYASMKGAIEIFTKYLAKELGPKGIAANLVAPGIIHTDFTKGAFSNEGLESYINSITALGRVGQPDDIGGVVAFLCSEDGRWVNAQRIEASGGMNL